MPDQNLQTIKIKSFFTSFHKKVPVLKSFVRISYAFNPKSDIPNPHLHDFEAIWDTGATLTSITQNVVNECNLKPIDIIKMSTAAGERQSLIYLINIMLPNNLGFPYLRVCECDIMGADVLIGMDLITLGDFAISNLNDKTSFTFRIPSLEIFDFRTLPPGVKKYKPRPNDPCPCGSGRKYKKCCSIRDKMKY